MIPPVTDEIAAIKYLSRQLSHEDAPVAIVSASVRYTPRSVKEWRPLVAEYFTDVNRAMCVIDWESSGDPNAVSPTDDHGLFQIHYPIWGPHFGVSRGELKNPRLNVRLAARILAAQGWGAWSAVTRGKC